MEYSWVSKIIRVDGPHSAPSEHYCNYGTAMIIGAGIGTVHSCWEKYNTYLHIQHCNSIPDRPVGIANEFIITYVIAVFTCRYVELNGMFCVVRTGQGSLLARLFCRRWPSTSGRRTSIRKYCTCIGWCGRARWTRFRSVLHCSRYPSLPQHSQPVSNLPLLTSVDGPHADGAILWAAAGQGDQPGQRATDT